MARVTAWAISLHGVTWDMFSKVWTMWSVASPMAMMALTAVVTAGISSVKSVSFSRPPRIRIMGDSKASRALMTASVLVALESLKNRMPRISPAKASRWARGLKFSRAVQMPFIFPPAARTASAAAVIFSRLWPPGRTWMSFAGMVSWIFDILIPSSCFRDWGENSITWDFNSEILASKFWMLALITAVSVSLWLPNKDHLESLYAL